MKFAEKIALVSIIATSFGLQVADSADQISERIHKHNWMKIQEVGSELITSDQLAILSRTQFPNGSTTIRHASSDGCLRTLADEAVEQVIYNENTEDYERSKAVLSSLAQVKSVSFNPSEETLEKQNNYLQKFIKVPLTERWNCFGIAGRFAQHLVETNPEQALEGMNELPLIWFQRVENNQAISVKVAYELFVKIRMKTGSMSSRVDHKAWSRLGSSRVERATKEPLVKSNRICLSDARTSREYIFPETNSCSSGEWKKITSDEYNKDQEHYNYYLIHDDGITFNVPSTHYYRQEKDRGENTKRAK